MPFFDGDGFHPAANKQKLAAGVPLTDRNLGARSRSFATK
jgi:gluconokinase